MGAVRIDLFTEESNIMDRGFWLVWTIVLFLTNMHLFTIMMDWSGVDYFDVFINCLDSHSDGTHSLQSIHW